MKSVSKAHQTRQYLCDIMQSGGILKQKKLSKSTKPCEKISKIIRKS